jgi:hypothetical protein
MPRLWQESGARTAGSVLGFETWSQELTPELVSSAATGRTQPSRSVVVTGGRVPVGPLMGIYSVPGPGLYCGKHPV